MIVKFAAAALTMMATAASADARQDYVSCLNGAVGTAKTANVRADGFKDYAHKTCAAVEDGFKAKLVSFNVKNGMSKTAAAKDADLQLDDYLYTYEEKYRYSAEPPK